VSTTELAALVCAVIAAVFAGVATLVKALNDRKAKSDPPPPQLGPWAAPATAEASGQYRAPGDTGRYNALGYDDLPDTGETRPVAPYAQVLAALQVQDVAIDALRRDVMGRELATKVDLQLMERNISKQIETWSSVTTAHAAELAQHRTEIAILKDRQQRSARP
jgi:hypothetical protein